MITKIGPRPLKARISEFWTPVSWSDEQLVDHLVEAHGFDREWLLEQVQEDAEFPVWTHRMEHLSDQSDHHIHYENA